MILNFNIKGTGRARNNGRDISIVDRNSTFHELSRKVNKLKNMIYNQINVFYNTQHSRCCINLQCTKFVEKSSIF